MVKIALAALLLTGCAGWDVRVNPVHARTVQLEAGDTWDTGTHALIRDPRWTQADTNAVLILGGLSALSWVGDNMQQRVMR